MRADGLYGDDDPMRWPQAYNPTHCHHVCIPRPNSLGSHAIIWWAPSHEDFTPFNHPTSLILGLGKLSASKLAELKSSVSFLLARVDKYTSNASSRVPPTLGPIVKMIEHGMARVEFVCTNFRQMQFGVRDVQRCWLDATATLDYMEVYKPRMDSWRLTVSASVPSAVADTMGVFTTDLRVAQDFVHAGLPCWLIRPASSFADINILLASPLLSSQNAVILTPHRYKYPVIFEGPSTSHQKYDAILCYARNFLQYPDLFNLPINNSSVASDANDTITTSINQTAPCAAGPSRHQNSNNRGNSVPGPSWKQKPGMSREARNQGRAPYSARRGRTFCYLLSLTGYLIRLTIGDGHNNNNTGPSGTSGRDKFLPIDSPIMPLSIPAWRDALAAVNKSQSIQITSHHDRHYIFPEPGIFANTCDTRRARFFATWNIV